VWPPLHTGSIHNRRVRFVDRFAQRSHRTEHALTSVSARNHLLGCRRFELAQLTRDS
jgi:hypothetical protein